MRMHFASDDMDPQQTEKASRAIRDMLGPQAVDQAVRQAISTCWMILPEGKKNVATLEAEMRRVFKRAIANLNEDAGAFGSLMAD